MKRLRERLRSDESGFTLPEMLVTILMMLVVLFALYGIFDASIRVFSVGNDRLEATQNARLGVERMEREVRAAYPQSGDVLLNSFEEDTITFQNMQDSDIPITITYKLNSASQTLGRRKDTENFQSVVGNVNDLEFNYCTTPENCTPTVSIAEEDIKLVRITLTVAAGDGEQTLKTDVNLRNRQ